MSSIKQLAGQTLWYGISNIAAKLLNVLLTPLITYILNSPTQQADYGDFSVMYATISFANVVFTYGMETTYFRFVSKGEDKDKLFQTSFFSLLISTIILSAIIIHFRVPISHFIGLDGHPEYIIWCVAIIAADTMAVVPSAKLRQEGRPRKYAFVRVAGVLVNIFLTVYFLIYSPEYVKEQPWTKYAAWYGHNTNAGFLLLANMGSSLTTLVLLYREWLVFRFRFDAKLWARIIAYSAPFIIIGLGGMVNETMDRIMLRRLLPASAEQAKMAVGIYGANYKISIFITLFITAFQLAASPFFFSKSGDKDAPKTYAKVMKWFVITLCFAFLFTALFLDIWQYMVGAKYRSGLGVVPVLLYANIALGIYYNLSIWYKITDNLRFGILITLIGAAITLVINIAFIPRFGMYACAWATFICYATMMVLSYLFGQKYYPVPYARKKLLLYLAIVTILFFIQKGIMLVVHSTAVHIVTGGVLLAAFVRLLMLTERKELAGFPVIGKFVKR